MRLVQDVLATFAMVLIVAIMVAVCMVAYREYTKPQPPVEAPPAHISRMLDLRLNAPLDPNPDKGQRGDRARRFECKEVPLVP